MHSFFGSNENKRICFRNLLTFSAKGFERQKNTLFFKKTKSVGLWLDFQLIYGFFFQIERKRCDTSEDAYCWVWLQVPSIKARIWSWRSKSKKQCKSTTAIALSNCIIWRCIVLCTYVYIFREFQLDYTGPQPKDSLSGVESLWGDCTFIPAD